ncbi:MAG: hypothetical protein WAK55_33905 [Xanthobacteraceae bacterium]
MSRAFVKEVEQQTVNLPDRPVSTHPNLVTAEGLAAIERTLTRFEAANKAAIAKNDRMAIAATNANFATGQRGDRPQKLSTRQPTKAKSISARR